MGASSVADTVGETPHRPVPFVDAIDRRAAIEALSVREAQAIVRHLFRRRPVFIFTDFGATMLAVYLTAFVYLSPGLSPLQIAAGAVSASLPEP
jgi:hypothetical protein